MPQFYFGILFTWRKVHQICSLPDVEQWETHLLKLPQGNEKLMQLIRPLSIFVAIPAHPKDLKQKFAPTVGLLHPNFLAWGILLG